jgi:hypothetical protein
MAFSRATMKVLENIYWFVCPFFLGITIYLTWKANKQIEALLLTVIGAAAIFYYWVKWFKVQKKEEIWPPVITPCPDYLTLVSPANTGGDDPVCMDFVGVSRQPKIFKKAKYDEIPQSSDADFESFTFTLDKRQSGDSIAEYNNKVCLKVASKGLTWQGVCE